MLRKENYEQQDIDNLVKSLILCCKGALALYESQSASIELTLCREETENNEMFNTATLPAFTVLHEDCQHLFWNVENLHNQLWELIKHPFMSLRKIEHTTNDEIKVLQVLAERGYWFSYQTIGCDDWLRWAIVIMDHINQVSAFDLSQNIAGWLPDNIK